MDTLEQSLQDKPYTNLEQEISYYQKLLTGEYLKKEDE